MKTYKNLFSGIRDFSNLLFAARLAAKGKTNRPYVLHFFNKLEENIFLLQEELDNHTYIPGSYSTFRIYEPKPRIISAAPFRDRVVHHALMNIIAPLFERSFIFDSYSNRVGKGTHAAIRRYQTYVRRFSYVLKCDIHKYFPSIDHDILNKLIRGKVSDKQTLRLIDTIIDGSNPQDTVLDYYTGDDLFSPLTRRKGLPIGNLTSQFFANLYLNPLDHFAKEELHCGGYVRYVDDFVLFADSKVVLREWKSAVSRYLEQFRLTLHPEHCYIFPTNVGWKFLGQRVFRTHRLLDSRNVRSLKRRLRIWKTSPPSNLRQRVASWAGHAMQADTYRLRHSLGLMSGDYRPPATMKSHHCDDLPFAETLHSA